MHAFKFISVSAVFLLALVQDAVSQDVEPVPLGGQCGSFIGTVCMNTVWILLSLTTGFLHPLTDSCLVLPLVNAATSSPTMAFACINALPRRPKYVLLPRRRNPCLSSMYFGITLNLCHSQIGV
ncbi:hypothetical protein B0H13DRAFT_2131839 [Mycena leptocephala]|nr:hypothetical protein B0H13DRAFT_2131839 [Mycena leptocephala]